MAGSFRKLRIIMMNENEGADLLSVEYPSQWITPFATLHSCRVANVPALHQRVPSRFRVRIVGLLRKCPFPTTQKSKFYLEGFGPPSYIAFSLTTSQDRTSFISRLG